MNFEQLITKNGLSIHGPIVFRPKVFSDDRGYFLESWNSSKWNEILINLGQEPYDFVQDNHSSSISGVLRGLHYQVAPHPQGKLVRCVSGEIFDVAIDLRKNSSTFLEVVGVNLSSTNFKQFWIPNGFAHGFLTLSKKAEVLYKTTDFWNCSCERSIRWNDPRLAIKWPLQTQFPTLSDKDSVAPFVDELSDKDLFL